MAELASEGARCDVDRLDAVPVCGRENRRLRHARDAAIFNRAVIRHTAPILNGIHSARHRLDKIHVVPSAECGCGPREPGGIAIDPGQMGPEAERWSVSRLAAKRRADTL